jgi:phosphoserine phosphatase RsbU/P
MTCKRPTWYSATFQRPILLILAGLFVATTSLYSVAWMILSRSTPVHLGANYRWTNENEVEVLSVAPGSPAEKAGLRARDLIVSVNGRRLADPTPFAGSPFYKYVTLGANRDTVQLGIKRSPNYEITVLGVLQPFPVRIGDVSVLKVAVLRLISFYPLFFLIVGATVLFLRLEDPKAWGLAFLFAGFIATAPLVEGTFPPSLRGFAIFYTSIAGGLAPAIFYWFFAVFPVSSPIDQRLPRLKWISLFALAIVYVPLAVACLFAGDRAPGFRIFGWHSRTALNWVIFSYSVLLYCLGCISLVWNSLWPPTPEVRRKTRIIVWGTLVGFVPAFLIVVGGQMVNKGLEDSPFWLWTGAVAATMLMPVSYAYAVVKDRVLEIPVLLKRSARYLIVQRGFVLVTFLISIAAILLFIAFFTRFFRTHAEMAVPASLSVGIVFGILAVMANLQIVPRVTKRIDRAFFRNAYDAREVLERLAHQTRTAAGRKQLAEMLECEINQALHPTTVAVFLQNGDCELTRQHNNGQGQALGLTDWSLLEGLVGRAEPMDVRGLEAASSVQLSSVFNGTQPECLVPILSSQKRLTGLIALGMRLSEEPYSGEDKRLLSSVAIQAGVALENISLAEKMAERMEADRHLAQEMGFARQVQARLLPQKQPKLRTLEYIGGCIQAWQVGGDYYDYLELRSGRVALVLADIAGKGVSGALLMANLQANLRSQYAMALEDPRGLLQSVNRLFYENTTESSYATLFFSEYDDSTQRLRYVNCGHLSPLILRGSPPCSGAFLNQVVERLEPTSTVLGLFEEWDCKVGEIELRAGDVLVIYTDGVTEAPNAEWEDFGEDRLIEVIRAHAALPAPALWKEIIAAVQRFSPGEQQDDITLLVARCKA